MNNTAIVSLEKIYSDGSGAPATVVCGGFYFSADFIGEARLRNLTGRTSPRGIMERAIRAYSAEVKGRAPAGWFELNTAMYAK